MDPDLRSQLNMLLINGGHDKKLQEQLLYTLNAQSNNWPTQVQNRALSLLRSGEVTTFPVLLKQILDEVRKETTAGPQAKSNSGSSSSSSSANGNAEPSSGGTNNGTGTTVQVNGSKKQHTGPGPGEASNLNREVSTSLAVPATVVDEALKVTREVLKEVAEFEEESNGAT